MDGGAYPMTPLPEPFKRHASGLYVPEEVSREREVWTRAEWKTVDRATKFLMSRGLTVHFGCMDDRCRLTQIEKRENLDGTVTLRCAHKDRVLIKEW